MKYILYLFFLLASLNARSQRFLKANGKMITDGDNHEIILRGMGLGGWMLQEPYMLQLSGVAGTQHQIREKIEALIGKDNAALFYKKWLANSIRKADIDSLAAWGFNSIRLPMHFNLFTLPVDQEPVAGRNTWLNTGFEMVDDLLKWCRADHVYLILDLHATPGGQGNDVAISDRDGGKPSLWESEANKQKAISLWRKLAERYSNEPWVGGYDLINETNWGFENPSDKNGCAETANIPLKKLLTNITMAIRQVDKNHLVFIEANCWANNYKGIMPLWDSNMVFSFHKYWNYNDQKSIEYFLHLREQFNVPVWMGEGGENSNAWFTDAIHLLEANKIGWSWWTLKKMGINNPFQIKMDSGYRQLINYWRNNGPKPDPAQAFKTLLQLTENVKAENTLFHKDVIDAMFRQVYSVETIPFKSNVIDINSRVFATDYDLGRSGFAYHDSDSADYHVSAGKGAKGNKGGMYRNDGVDIDACNDSITNGFKVTSIEAGEWLKYSLNIKKSGLYDMALRTFSNGNSGQVKVIVNNKELKSSSIDGSSKGWNTEVINNLSLTKGLNELKLYIESGGFELNFLQFVRRDGNLEKNKSKSKIKSKVKSVS